MGKPKAPPAPDYKGAAQEQGAANLNATLGTNYLNQVSQVGPEGSLTYNYDTANGHRLPDGTVIPRTTAVTSLSPAQQKLYDQNTQISTALNDLASRGIGYVDQASANPVSVNGPEVNYGPGAGGIQGQVGGTDYKKGYDFSGVSKLPTMDDFASQRDQVVEALMSRHRPDMDYSRDRLGNQLANQGLAPGSEAYNREMDLQNRAENDARMGAVLAGSQEQSRLFNQAMASRGQGVNEAMAQGDMFNRGSDAEFAQDLARGQFYNQGQESVFNRGLASSQFSNQARQQALQEADYFKNQPLNMLNALRTGNQVSMPQFQNVATGAQIQAAPIYQATADAGDFAQKNYQNKMAGFGSMLSGLATLGGAGLMKWG